MIREDIAIVMQAPAPTATRMMRRAILVLFALMVALGTVASVPPSFPGLGAALAAERSLAGTPTTFWAVDWGEDISIQLNASASYEGEHAVIYVAQGEDVSPVYLQGLGSAIDTRVYPSITGALGSEPNPGVDGDARLVILLYDFNDPTLGGFFDPADIYPRLGGRSNGREMVYVNLEMALADVDIAASIVSHELAHLICFYRDYMLDPASQPATEEAWVEEGIATYAEHLAGYDGRTSSFIFSFEADTNFNLTEWEGSYRSEYGASYAFVSYLLERTSPDVLGDLVNEPLDGMSGINAVLGRRGYFDTFASIFDDWVLANYLDMRGPPLAPYAYGFLDVESEPVVMEGSFPLVGSGEVNNFGALYLDVPPVATGATVRLVVDGQDGTPLHAAVLSWDSARLARPSVAPVALTGPAEGGWVSVAPGYDRHTLVVWSRGVEGFAASYGFRYSIAVDPPGEIQFLDVGGDHRFYPEISDLLARGVVSGQEIPPGSGLWFFQADSEVKRAQFAKMIVEATGLHTPEVNGLERPTFSDVPVRDRDGNPLAYPFDYVEEAAAAGLVGGMGDGTFRPYESITRIQLVRMILRAASAVEEPLTPYRGSETVFADVTPKNPLYGEVMTAYQNGIMGGSRGTDGRLYFRPWSVATRGHVAKMTYNLLTALEGGAPAS